MVVNRMIIGVLVAGLACLTSGCTVVVSDSGGGGGTTTPTRDTDGTAPTGTSPADDVGALLADPSVAKAMAFGGDGMAAKRQLIPDVYPEVARLAAGATEAAEAMLAQFTGDADPADDEALFLFAVALEQMNYAAGVDRLADFLDRNIVTNVPLTLEGLTHTLRILTGQQTKSSASYRGSEKEETLAALGARGSVRANGGGPRGLCNREFVLLDADGNELRDANGNPIIVGGQVRPGDTPLLGWTAEELNALVRAGGGDRTNFTDPQVPGVTWTDDPTPLYNCAGFTFRQFNGGEQWTGDPGDWYDVLVNRSELLERVDDIDAESGDFVFYFQAGDDGNLAALPGHVAEVQSTDAFGQITVINADNKSGMFTANANAAYFFGRGTLAELFGIGFTPGVQFRGKAVYRWKSGSPPRFKLYTDRSPAGSCHGCDLDGDKFPDTDNCDDCPPDQCLDPEFIEEPPEDETEGCSNTCILSFNGFCEDGGDGSTGFVCEFGTDCADCGPRDEDTGGVTDPVGTVAGVVVDATNGQAILGATVRLDRSPEAPVSDTTGADGSYGLFIPDVPDFVAISASADGFIPETSNVSAATLVGTTLVLNFELEPEDLGVIVIEAIPDVHHLGDDEFSGAINSQFQKASEGLTFTASFELLDEQLPPLFNTAELHSLLKGAQCPNTIQINGQTLGASMTGSPGDGSFGTFTTPLDVALLQPGTNTISITAEFCLGGIDDFEFVNVQIRLSR